MDSRAAYHVSPITLIVSDYASQASVQLLTHDVLLASRAIERESARGASSQTATGSNSSGRDALLIRNRAESNKVKHKVWSLISKAGAIDQGNRWRALPSTVDLEPIAFRAIVGLIERAQQELMRI